MQHTTQQHPTHSPNAQLAAHALVRVRWRWLVWLALLSVALPLYAQEAPTDDYVILFSSDQDTGANWQLYRLDANRPTPSRITQSDAYDYGATPNADGSLVAFTRRNANGFTEIYVRDLRTQEERLLTQGRGAAWSADGTQIAFTSSESGNNDIYLITPEGFNRSAFTSNPAHDYAPSWSRDGRWLAFKSNRDGSPNLYIVRPTDRTQIRNLTPTDATHAAPSWSPNNAQIAYTRRIDGLSAVHIVDVETGQSRRISPTDANDHQPIWTPDGEWIVFVSIVNRQPDLYRMKPDGSAREPLLSLPSWEWNPSILQQTPPE